MTEPPRPPGAGDSADPTRPINPHSGNDPTSEGTPPPAYGPPDQPTAYGPPDQPTAYGPPDQPTAYSPPPTSGAGGYAPPPTSGPPPGYGAPPPGHGAAPQGYGAAPHGYASTEDKTWALVAHFGGIVIGFIAPLIVLLARGNQSPTVRAHAVEALNFQITWGIITVVASILAVCTAGILFFLPTVTWIVVIVFAILAGIKANDGEVYRYPMTWRPVK